MTSRRLAQLVLGCFVLGVGVALLLTPKFGSDGFSTLVLGVSETADIAFVLANALVAATFVGVAWLRGLRPGVGTITQIVVVGAVADGGLRLLELGDPYTLWLRLVMVVVAFPILALGISLYLGTKLGAGPAEAPALAWDPPVPFKWSYSAVQGGGALFGWLLGAPIGAGTVAVILLLGPVVDLTARLLRLDIAQDH